MGDEILKGHPPLAVVFKVQAKRLLNGQIMGLFVKRFSFISWIVWCVPFMREQVFRCIERYYNYGCPADRIKIF